MDLATALCEWVGIRRKPQGIRELVDTLEEQRKATARVRGIVLPSDVSPYFASEDREGSTSRSDGSDRTAQDSAADLADLGGPGE